MALNQCAECKKEISSSASKCPHCGYKVRSNGIGYGCAILLAVIAIPFFISLMSSSNADKNGTSDSTNEITDTKYKEAVRQLIVSNGYDCPNITNLDILDPASPYGPKLEALCGFPDDNTHVNVNLNYAVYPERFLVQTCKPWAMFSSGCN